MVKTPRFYCREKVQSLVGELRSHMLHSKANKQTNMQEMLSDSHSTQKCVCVDNSMFHEAMCGIVYRSRCVPCIMSSFRFIGTFW